MLTLASYARQKKKHRGERSLLSHNRLVRYASLLQALFSMPLTLYVWYVTSAIKASRYLKSNSNINSRRSTAESFGSQPACNSNIKYIFLFAEVNAVSKARTIALVYISLFVLFYIPMTSLELWDTYNDHMTRNSFRDSYRPIDAQESQTAPTSAPKKITEYGHKRLLDFNGNSSSMSCIENKL